VHGRKSGRTAAVRGYETVERDWFRRTGISPMMHLIAVPRELLDAHPGSPRRSAARTSRLPRTYLRYHHEQGLSAKRWTFEEVFCPDLLDT
jgi:4,5-dihydroxyphthalate decarboxylase